MFCPNCGMELGGEGKFCPNCGAPRPQPGTDGESLPPQQEAPASGPDAPAAGAQPASPSPDKAPASPRGAGAPKRKSKLPLLIGGIVCAAIATVAAIAVLLGGGDEGLEIDTVQKGYLGEFTDMTVAEILDGYYCDFLGYAEGTWDSGITDDGTTLVQVEYVNEELGPITIQFSMLDEDCFKVTAFVDPLEEVKEPSDLLAALNKLYLLAYTSRYPQEEVAEIETELLERLASVDASSVRYGASEDYVGSRSRLYRLFDDAPLEMSAVELLNLYDVIDTGIFADEPDLPGNPYEFTDEEIASLEWVSVDSLANYMMPDYDGRWILLTDVYIDSMGYGYDGTDGTLVTAIGINYSYLNITCYDTDTYHAVNLLNGADMIGRCVFHEDGKYYEIVDAILYGQSPTDIIAASTDNAYASGQEAAWNVYADAVQGTEGYCVAVFCNGEDQEAAERAAGFYDEAVLQIGFMPWDIDTYVDDLTDFMVYIVEWQEAGVDAVYLPSTDTEELNSMIPLLLIQCSTLEFYPAFYDAEGNELQFTIDDMYGGM